jgi:hypothetical protein
MAFGSKRNNQKVVSPLVINATPSRPDKRLTPDATLPLKDGHTGRDAILGGIAGDVAGKKGHKGREFDFLLIAR